MAEAEAGLELPIGLTEQKFLQQLARIEAKAIKASNGMAKKFANDNKSIADSFKTAADSADVFNRELDAARMKWDPLFAASKRYEASLQELNRDHKIGALSIRQYEQALENLNADFARATDGSRKMGQSLGGLSGQARAGLQNVSYQLQDIFVQIQGGQGATRALSQQLPQLLSGFGLIGGAFGLVAAAGIPLAASFFNTGQQAANLTDAVSDLERAVSDYRSAIEAADAPLEDLIEKYGRATGAARALLEQTEALARVQALQSMKDAVASVTDAFSGLADEISVIEYAASQGYGLGDPNAARAAQRLRDEFGLTTDQARQLFGLITNVQNADSLKAQGAAIRDLASFMSDVAVSSTGITSAFVEQTAAVNAVALSMLEVDAATEDARDTADGLLATIKAIDFSNPINGAKELSGVMGTLVGQAQALLDRLGAAAKAARQRIQNAVANGNALDPLGAFNGGQSASTAVQVNAGGTIRTPVLPPIPGAAGAGRGGGGREGRGGSGGGGARDVPSSFDGIERDLINLQRELTLVGKSNQEVATAKARWEALDEAKRRGIPINAQMSAQIDAQAEQFGRLTAELERAEASQQQFEQAVDGIADAMAGALVAGESLREGLAQVLKQIASDILSSGIRSLIMSQFGGFSLGSIFGGGDKLTGALKLAGARAKGGPVSANRAYMVGEEGPEIMVPGSSGHIIPNHKIGGGGQSVVMVQLSPELRAQVLAEARGQSLQISQQAVGANSRKQTDMRYLREGK